MLAADHLAKMFKVSQRSVFKCIEAGAVHFTELVEGGAALICIASFANASGLQLDDESIL
ncbi:MAG TPA: hypothetical protein PKA82_06085 [Pyrinomonadaceae bacterium]|nr:hypothetical protein [Pyrinomonadaceae bacterium]